MPKFTPALQELENTFTEPQTGPFVDQGGSVGFDVRAYGAVLDGASDDAAALNAALAAVQAAGVQVVTVAGGAARIASNVTIPSGVTLRVLEGATIKPAAGATLTINGTFDAGLYSVFDLSEGGSVVLGRGATERALPQWWGARGDGVTDDTAAIDAWLAQAGELFLPTGIYLADAFTPRSDSTIRCAAGAEVVCRTQTEVFALLSNLNDVTIEGLHIDGANLTTRCIYILSCSSVTLLNPKVENLFQPSGAAVEAVGIRITNGRNILIRDPVIRNVVATPDSITGNTPGLARGIHISAVDPAVLENIRIHGGLIEDIEPLEDADGIACFAPDYGDGASNHDVVIDGVTIRRAHKRAVKIQMNGVRVQNCRIFLEFRGSTHGEIQPLRGIESFSSNVEIVDNSVYGGSCQYGFSVGVNVNTSSNIIVRGNRFIPDPTAQQPSAGVRVGNSASESVAGLIVEGNILANVQRGVDIRCTLSQATIRDNIIRNTGQYGISVASTAAVTDLGIEGNKFGDLGDYGIILLQGDRICVIGNSGVSGGGRTELVNVGVGVDARLWNNPSTDGFLGNRLGTDLWAEAGGMKQTIIFTATDLPVGANTVLNLAGSPYQEFVVPMPGSVVAMSVRTSADRTAGSITFRPYKNGAGQTAMCTIDAANVRQSIFTLPQDASTLAAGDRLGVRADVSADFAPAALDVVVALVIEM